MANRSITSSNSVIMFSIPDLFPQPQQIQGYAADDVFDTDALEAVETQMGVDGLLSAGFLFMPIMQNFTLQPNSPSIFFFDQWYAASQTAREIFFATGVIRLTSVGAVWNMANGVLKSYKPVPDSGKVLKPQKFGIVWESITKAPI